MRVLEAIVAWVPTRPAIAASMAAAANVFPGFAPANARRPYLICDVVSDPHDLHMGGTVRYRHPLVKFEAWGDTAEAATALADALDGELHGFFGRLGGLFVKPARRESRRGPTPVETEAGSSQRTYLVEAEYEIWHGA